MQTSRGTLQITIPVPGRHMITNALAAVAVGQQMGLSDEEIVQGIAAFRPVVVMAVCLQRNTLRLWMTVIMLIRYPCGRGSPVI